MKAPIDTSDTSDTTGNFVRRVVRQMNVTAYPNPAKDELHLLIDGEARKKFALEIIDLLGRRRYFESEFLSNRKTISLKGLSDGVYILRLKGDKVLHQLRFVKSSVR
ncbi:MAG: T9SS type A sorting domain-containing protein [Bacteroidetes bacterium]|nr:T9SS type A sorting domain-containing protein [Bacteroidota bacterium]